MLALGLRFLLKASSVSASDLYYHPQFCAGGWQNPHFATGDPQNFSSKSVSDFDNSNSAYLESGVASQIFCGFFPVDSREEAPGEVRLRFHWMMDFGGNFIPSTVQYSNPENDSSNDSVQSSESPQVPSEPEVGEISPEPVQEKNLEEESSEEPIPESTPEPTSNPTVEEEVTLLDRFIKTLFKTAEAQGLGSSEDYLSISYSLDGVRWIMVGRVNHNNWQDLSVSIPISSWEDLSQIQVMLNALPTLGSKPGVYLDGISLEIEYDRPFTEAVTETVEDTTATVITALDLVAEQITQFFSGEEAPKQQEKEPLIVKERKLTFSLSEGKINTTRSLPWYSNEFRDKVSVRGDNGNIPKIEIEEDGKSMVISGECEESLFVVLLWKNQDDYINKPGSFASNFADHCYDGVYRYDLKNLSNEIDDGPYYLLVASEDETNPWVPASALVPINISSIIEEKVIEE